MRSLHCSMLLRLTALCKQQWSPCRVRKQHAAREQQRLERMRYNAQRPELLKAELQAARETAQEREALRWRAAELGKVVAVASWVAHLRELLLRRRKQRQVEWGCMPGTGRLASSLSGLSASLQAGEAGGGNFEQGGYLKGASYTYACLAERPNTPPTRPVGLGLS